MRRIFYVLAATLATITFSACSSGGGGGNGGDLDPPVADVSGTWSISETMGGNTCGETVGTVDSYTITATLNGNSLTVNTPAGTFTGTLDGNQIEWTGSYPEDGGTTTIESMDVTVSADGNTLSGTTSWSWTDGGFSCSGTTSVSGTRTSGPPGGGATETEPNDDPTMPNTVTGTITGSVDSNSDEFDTFRFTAPSTGTYTVTVTWSNINNDVDLGVFEENGDVIGLSVDTNTTSESVGSISRSTGQTMIIAVRAFDTSGAQSYTLTVQ